MDSKKLTLIKGTWEASLWVLACLVDMVSWGVHTKFDSVSVTFFLLLTAPVALMYGFFEYRYVLFNARPENKHSARGLREELFWGVLAVISAAIWTYIEHRKRFDPLMFLQNLAIIRAWYFIIGSINFGNRRS